MLPILCRELRSECTEACRNHIINIYGWSGSISVISAYGLTSFDSDKLVLIDCLNLYGSLSIGIMCYRAKVWQATILEIAWFIVGSYSMIQNMIDDEEHSSVSC